MRRALETACSGRSETPVPTTGVAASFSGTSARRSRARWNASCSPRRPGRCARLRAQASASRPEAHLQSTLDLAKLQAVADAIVADDDLPERRLMSDQVEKLLLIGTSMGGARPKAVIEDDAGLWIAKFNVARTPGTARASSTPCCCSRAPAADDGGKPCRRGRRA